MVDVTHPGIREEDGKTYIPDEAIFPHNLFSGDGEGCKKTSIGAHVPALREESWPYRDFDMQRIIFLCPKLVKKEQPRPSAPVQLPQDEKVKTGDDLFSLFGPPMVLIHELFHTHLMRWERKKPSEYTPGPPFQKLCFRGTS